MAKKDLHVVVDFCIIPLGVGLSLAPYIRKCQEILKKAKLKTNLHAYGTNIEGNWDDVFGAIKKCHEALHKDGVPRISTSIKVGTRTDKPQTIDGKIQSVKGK